MTKNTTAKLTFHTTVRSNDLDLSILATKLKQEVLEKEAYLQNASDSAPERHPDPLDKATIQSFQTINSALIRKDITRINKINKALVRIAGGTFGICEDCGESIDIKRLEVRPESSRCINCAEVAEQKKNKNTKPT